MKLSRAIVVALFMTAGMACLWAAQTPPAPAAPASASAPAATPAPAPAATAAPAPAKIDFKNDQEKLGYAIGCNVATNLKNRPTPVNMSAFSQGLSQAFNGQPTDEEKLSYALGCDLGNQLKRQEVPVDLAMLTQAVTAILNKQTPAMTDEQSREAIAAWQKDAQTKAEAKRKEQGDKNLVEGKAFLEANAKKEGVKVLENGLQYKVIKDGTGNSPAATDKVKVNYKGTLVNGTEFDSSYKRGQPAEFQVGRVIPGWTQGLQLMKEGAKWELYIPANLAYGENPPTPTIPPNSVLIFEVELLEVIKAPAAAAPAPGAAVITPNAAAPATRSAPAPQAKPQQ
jgi:FKBP-type peptidyl-prolyl cis-trans isomerase FklB